MRTETNKLLDKINEGLLDSKNVVIACVKWMSEDDVADMADANEWSDRFADGPHCREEDEYMDDGPFDKEDHALVIDDQPGGNSQ